MKLKKIKSSIANRIKHIYYLKCYYKKPIEENVVLIESKQGEDIASNMFYVLKEIALNHKQFKIKLSANSGKVNVFTKMLKQHKIENVEIIIHKSFEYYKALATAKYLFNDTSFPMEFTKREGQIYTNTWHGTPLKQMGQDVMDRKYAIRKCKKEFHVC